MDMQSPGILGMEAFYEVIFVDQPRLGPSILPKDVQFADQIAANRNPTASTNIS